MSETRPAYDARAIIDSQMTEKAFSQMVVDLAQLHGWLVYRTWNSIHSPKGYPDLTLCKPPRLIFAELKTEKGKLSAEQMRWYGALLNCAAKSEHQRYYLWRPLDWPAIERIVRGDE